MNTPPTFKIENIVASLHPTGGVDLNYIAASLENAEYNKVVFPGLVYRTKDPKTAFLIFGSGKANCTGANSMAEVDMAIDIMTDDLTKLGYTITSKDYTVQNIVAIVSLNKKLDLDAIATSIGLENIEYEPEIFPCIVYRIKDTKAVVLIFNSGKLLITGAKTQEDCKLAIDDVWRWLHDE